ncbi:MAG TPA: hypothetical protein VMI54_15540 [Polyangiaceae bacterium]|nr:hypothetical protein [Polyangiaceae bacterium]
MNKWKFSTLALVVLLGVTLGRSWVNSASAETQPHMDAALKHLNDARAELAAAESDKGGHRVKALGFTDQAIKQVEAGIAFANKH